MNSEDLRHHRLGGGLDSLHFSMQLASKDVFFLKFFVF
jgi:hypothetical protein